MPPVPSPDEGRIFGGAHAITDPTHEWYGLTYQELGLLFLGSEFGEDIPARMAPWPLILRRLPAQGDFGEDVVYIHVWLALLRMPSSSIVVQARWYPGPEETYFSFMDVPHNVTNKQLAKARRALMLWREGKFSGGRSALILEQDQALFEEVIREYLALEARLNDESDSDGGRSVTIEEVKDALYRSKTTITNMLVRCALAPYGRGIKWWQVREAARNFSLSGAMPRVSWHDRQKPE